MTDKERLKIKTKIKEDIATLHHEIEELQEKIKPIAPDCSLGRLTRQEMMQEQQINEHALRETEIRLNKLKFALQKVDKKEYGICEECEEDIPFARLMILPESTHCVVCMNELGL